MPGSVLDAGKRIQYICLQARYRCRRAWKFRARVLHNRSELPAFFSQTQSMIAWKKFIAASFSDFFCGKNNIARKRIDRFMRLDAAETGIFVAEIAETAYQHPFKSALPAVVTLEERFVFSLTPFSSACNTRVGNNARSVSVQRLCAFHKLYNQVPVPLHCGSSGICIVSARRCYLP